MKCHIRLRNQQQVSMSAREDSIVCMPLIQGILKKRKDKMVSVLLFIFHTHRLRFIRICCILDFLDPRFLDSSRSLSWSHFMLFMQRKATCLCFCNDAIILLFILEAEMGYVLVQTSSCIPSLLQHQAWKHCKYSNQISAFEWICISVFCS